MKVFSSQERKKYVFLAAVLLFLTSSGSALLQAGEMTDTREGISEAIRLPEPLQDSTTSIEKAIRERRSVRSFKEGSLTLSEVSQLLWAAQGITTSRGLRAAPSAGALYPIEVYLVSGSVDNLPDGVYHYKPIRHELIRVIRGDKRTDLCAAALGQSSVRNAAAVIVLAAVYERTTVKYGERGIQYVHMEIGHAAQNVFLQAVPLNLGTVVIGAFRDAEVRKVLKMPEREQPLYVMPVGRIK